jgi:hypothetical protein
VGARSGRPRTERRSKDREGKCRRQARAPPRFRTAGGIDDHAFPPRPLLSLLSFITSPNMMARPQQKAAANDQIAPFVPFPTISNAANRASAG